MINKNLKILFISLSLIITGCASNKKKYIERLPDIPSNWSSIYEGLENSNGWIDSFEDQRLYTLINEALENNKDLVLLETISKYIGCKTYKIDYNERKILHLAAIFSNNFVNHMFTIAKDLLDAEDLNFNILKPLIDETVNKIHKLDLHNNPHLESQIAAISDDIAYNNHDVEDALRAKLISLNSLREIKYFNEIIKEINDR